MASVVTERPIIVALDFPDVTSAFALVGRLEPTRCRVKVGKELFTRGGPEVVRRLVEQGFDVFLDLKFHDIPNTVTGACKAAVAMGVWMLNVHAVGGRTMMETAREAVGTGRGSPLLIGVTMLTSLSEADLVETGQGGTPAEHVVRLAVLAESCGLDGVVCSGREIGMLRQACAENFRLVTPGIRPQAAALADQRRVMTPGEAVAAGSDYLVIGRPITAAPEPMDALAQIENELLTAKTRSRAS